MASVKKGVKVRVESTSYFTDKEKAREYAIKILEAGALFLEINEWYEDVEDPEPVDPEPEEPKPKPEKKKVPFNIRKKPGPKPGPVPGTTSKYSQEVIDYIKEHYPTTKRKKLVPRINKMFGLNLNDSRLSDIIRKHGLTKRSHGKKDKGVDPDEAFDEGVDELDLDD